MASNNELLEEFRSLVRQEVAVPVCAMKTLISVIKRSNSATWMQLEQELRNAIHVLKELQDEDLCGRTNIFLGSGCDLFMKYVTRAFLEYTVELIRRGENFASMSLASRSRIAEVGHSFVQDGCTVLTHGNSRVVMALLLRAAAAGKHFNIILTEARPSENSTAETAKQYEAAGIPTRVILDCAVGICMEKVQLCLVGAEGVTENGGIVNQLGTFQISVIAKAMKCPVYVAVESYKFARMYPLLQQDVSSLENGLVTANNTAAVDFTPAEYITLLFTDLGVLTPAAVSDELIRLYQ